MNQRNKPSVSAVVVLGLVQILSWGGSFYLMAVMAAPIVAETGWSQQWVYGALSLGILVSGLLAPLCGRIIARTGGRMLLALSGAVMAAGLVVMGLSHSLPLFLGAWVIIGVGMAMGLYDALFATLGTCYGGQARSAITSITLISGFCTTLVWPGTALLIHLLSWRGACFAIAAMLLLLVLPASVYALPNKAVAVKAKATSAPAPQSDIAPSLFWLLCAIFTLASVIMTAMSVQLIALLQASGYTLAAALGLSAILGPCQVGSRIVDILFKRGHPIWTAFFLGRSGGAWPAVAGAVSSACAAQHGVLRCGKWSARHRAGNFTAGDGQTRGVCRRGWADGASGAYRSGADAAGRGISV
ncbi:MFS transporter [Pantoea tagorei]